MFVEKQKRNRETLLFYLVNIKVVYDGIKTRVEIIEQGHNLQKKEQF